MKITLIVSGSIAAYKSAEIVRELVKTGHEVHVVLTKGGEKFITSLTLQTLSGNAVTRDLFDEAREAEINHIRLADQADVLLVAPASADLIAKLAHGLADDSASTIALATKAPMVIAPAMNVNMWENVVTQENVTRLKQRGVLFVEPEVGSLACGWEGAGRLAPLEDILFQVEKSTKKQDFSGIRVVVTAGPTREALDPMRFISNRSSGKMGFALAKRAAMRGAEVELISGPSTLKPPSGVRYHSVTSAEEMEHVVRRELEAKGREGIQKQVLVMAAAVCDHKPESVSREKMKQKEKAPYSLSLIPNQDILARCSQDRSSIEQKSGLSLRIVGFAAESGVGEEMLEFAREKLKKKGLDLLVANSIAQSAEQDTNEVALLTPAGGEKKIGVASKDVVADKILDSALKL